MRDRHLRPRRGGLGALAEVYRQAFSGLPAPVWRLSLVILVHRSGTMVLPFLALYLIGPLAVPVETAGLGLGVWGLGSVVGTYAGGRLTDRFGSRAVQAASLVSGGAGLIALEWLPTPGTFFAGLFVTAACADAFRPANAVALAEVAPPLLRSRAFALRRAAVNLGMTLGPVAGGFLAQVDYAWLFRIDGLTCLSAAILLVRLVPRPERAAAAPGDVAPVVAPDVEASSEVVAAAPVAASPLRDRPFVAFLLLTVVTSGVLFQFLSAFPVALRNVYGLDEGRIGLVFAANTLLVLAFEMVLMHRLAAVSALRLAAWGGLFIGLGYGLVPLGDSFAFAVLVILVVTVGEMLGLPPIEAWAASRVEGAGRGRYLGLFNVGFAVALTVGPAAGTWIYGRYGGGVLWPGCAVAGVALWLGFTALDRSERSSSSSRRLRHSPPP